jgi:hypothetical protein
MALNAALDEVGDVADEELLTSGPWPEVVVAAGRRGQVMVGNDLAALREALGEKEPSAAIRDGTGRDGEGHTVEFDP